MSHNTNSKFTLLPKQSIGLYAESIGNPNLKDDVLTNLSEDLTYRLREALNSAMQIMRHSKRRCLTTDDFNTALKWSDSQAIYGQNGVDVSNFRSFNFKDSTVSYIEDRDANLRETAFDSTLPADPGEVSIKAQWLVFEGHSCSSGKQSRDEIGNREVLEEPSLTFLEQIVSSVFGNNSRARKAALDNIRTNGKLQSILPYLVTFLASQVKACDGNDSLKTIAMGVLQIAQALVENTSLFLVPYVFQMMKLLLFVVTDGQLPVEYWDNKLNAARILTHLCRRHMSTMNYLPHHLLKAYQETIHDDSKPPGATYGAAYGISCLGAEPTHQVIYPVLVKKCESLREIISDSNDVEIVHGSLLLFGLFEEIVLFLLRTAASNSSYPSTSKSSRASTTTTTTSTPSTHKYFTIYSEIFDLFNEGLIAHTQFQHVLSGSNRNVFNPSKATISKQNVTKVKETNFGLQNIGSNSSFLKVESPAVEERICKVNFPLRNQQKNPLNIKVEKLSSYVSNQTSLGVMNTELKWRRSKLNREKSIYFEDLDQDNQDAPTKAKKRRMSNVEARPKHTKQFNKELISKMTRKFNKITRSRLAELSRIPSTTYLII